MPTLRTLSFAFGITSFALAACGGDVVVPGDTSSGGAGPGPTVGAGGTSVSAVSVGAGGTVTASVGSGGAGGAPDVDILERLSSIPGASVYEDSSEIDGYRLFYIDFEQPVDHSDPNGQHFTQRLMLHHIDDEAPFVLASTGYYLWEPYQYLEEPAQLLNGNQIIVEHRYFYPSRPDPADWSLLNIAQAAADHHRVVEAFREIYTGKWISTGASKGGMTSVYHRRFYPDDVDGTVAYVAPHSGVLDDPRYIDFLNQVGDEACRQKLRDFQREVLLRRGAMLARMDEQAAQYGVTFNYIGIDPTLESTVIAVPFTFWQYAGADRCKDIPTSAASDDAVWAFFVEIGSPITSSDPYVLGFEPYYWQAYTQLGAPGITTDHLSDLLLYDLTAIDDMPSVAEEPVFDPAPMQDVGSWLSSSGSRILFIYGETDPWTAGAFELGGAKESHKLVMPGGNHGAIILGLAPGDQQIALAALESWTGVVPDTQQKVMQPRPAPPPFRVGRRWKTH